MATERLSMRKTKEILRQKWVLGRSHRAMADSIGVGAATVSDALARARAAGLDWAQVEPLSEEELEKRLYVGRSPPEKVRPLPNWKYIHTELRKRGVTLALLHLEYFEQHPDGYRYSRFCEAYRRWARSQGATMRQVHRAGEKLFVDYSGAKPEIVDRTTGESVPVELFVGVLGASNYTYAEASRTQQGPDWIASHVRTFEYIGGVTDAVVCDQLKSGVARPCRYEPEIQRTYEEMAGHYGTTVLPARPRRPKDKAKVEAGVLVVQRLILARLRNQTFFSIDEMNARIRELLVDLNDRTMEEYGASRRDLFERLDRPALKPLPAQRFVFGQWKIVRVNIDYHVEVDGHYYSAPHGLIHEHVEARATATTVEIFFRGQRVASHPRSYEQHRHTTCAEHMPKSHQKHLEWTPSRLVHWAATIGPQTERLVNAILADRPHPEQGYRSCLGILRLGRRYGDARLEAAAARALAVHARSYRHVESILKKGLDRVPLDNAEPADRPPIVHENIRGPNYYQ